MIKLFSFLPTIFLFSFSAVSQATFFTDLHPSDTLAIYTPYHELQLNDGSFISTGEHRYNSWESDIQLTKRDVNGDTLWTRFLGIDTTVDSREYGQLVMETSDGNLMILCKKELDSKTFAMCKVTTDGDPIWLKQYYCDSGNKIYPMDAKRTQDGGYIVTGRGTAWSANNSVALFKLDADGNVDWVKYYAFSGEWPEGNKVTLTSDGGYAVAGFYNWMSSTNTPFILKTDGSGNLQWVTSMTTGGQDAVLDVHGCGDGFILFSGKKISSPGENEDGFIGKLSSDGLLVWCQNYQVTDSSFSGYAQVDEHPDGGYYAIGYHEYDTTNAAVIVRFGDFGDIMWTNAMEGLWKLTGSGRSTEGGYYLGASGTTTYFRDDFLAKTDSSGNVTCNNVSIPVVVMANDFVFASETFVEMDTVLYLEEVGVTDFPMHPFTNDVLCSNLGLDAVAENVPLTIYPNPTSGLVNINTEVGHLQLFNFAGQLILEKKNISQFDLSVYPSGLYLVRLDEMTKKVVKR